MLLKNPLAFLALLALLAPGIAQTKSSPAPPVADAKQDDSKEAYVVEHVYTRINETGDGTGVREVDAAIKILAEAGVKAFAVLAFTYSSANQTVDVDYVRVRKADGTVVKTPDYNIQDMPAEVSRTAPLYSDIHEKHVAVKGLGVGDVLEYLVRYRTTKPDVPGQFWYEYTFDKDSIERDEQLEVNVPADKYLKVVSPNFKPEIVNEGARRTYKWKHANLTVKQKDPDQIPLRVWPNPDVQWTTFSSWADVGAWYGGLQKLPLQITPAIKAKAAELTRSLSGDDEKIHAIYNFVSLKYHYIGLDFGIGRFQPHAADDVLDNGYGDCKDKHTLLAALLMAAGYEAWPALIHPDRKVDAEVPSPAQFNHVITVVPRGSDMIWLDTTPEVAPYQLLMPQLRDKLALVIPASQPASLRKTPENPPFPMEQDFTAAGKLSDDGTFTGHIEQSYRGDVEVALRTAIRRLSESQWKDAIQRLSYALNFGGDVSNVKISPADHLDQPLTISYDYVRKNFGDWDDQYTSAAVPPVGLEIAKDSKMKKPLESIFLGQPGRVVHRSRMELPAGYSLVPPSPARQVESFAEYKADTKVENGTLTVSRELTLKKSEVPLSDWDTYRKFGRAIYDDESATLRLNHEGGGVTKRSEEGDDAPRLYFSGGEALRVNDFTQARSVFERLIAKDPKYPGAHLGLGIALMMLGKTDQALAELRKEEEISPADARAYQSAAMSLVRLKRKDEAIAEWRKLLKVDPGNQAAAVSESGLLTEEGKYQDAIAELEKAATAAPENAQLRYALGSAYLKTPDKEKGAANLRRAVELKAGDFDMLNNSAYALAESKIDLDVARQLAEQALQDLEIRSAKDSGDEQAGALDSFQFSLLWDTLGWVYFQSGDAAKSESYVRSAWLLGQHPVVGEHLGEIYEKEAKKTSAAHTYRLALGSVNAMPPWVQSATGIGNGTSVTNEKLSADMTARYEKITGKKPAINEMLRLPNGEWTKTAAEELTQMRTVKFGKLPNFTGSAEFRVAFVPGKIETIDFVRGDKSLQGLVERIKSANFSVEFPAESKARIYRKIELSCFPVSGCMAVLIPVSRPQPHDSPTLPME